MTNNDFKHISSILSEVLKENGIEKILKYQLIKREWQNIVGEELSKICHIHKIKDDAIVIKLENPSWRTELMLQRNYIINKINDRIGEKLIKSLRFV